MKANHLACTIVALQITIGGCFGGVASVNVALPPEATTLSLAIHAIQGAGHRSPYRGEVVTTEGVVTALAARGFWIESVTPDTDESTSEGLFIYTANAPSVAIGDRLSITGAVTEYYPGGYDSGNLSLTELTAPSIQVLSSGNPLPLTILGAAGRAPPGAVIDDDATGDVETSGVFDPVTDGIDFFESLEGMRVVVPQAIAVGPSNIYGETPVVGDGGAFAGLRTIRGGLLLRAADANPERIILDNALRTLPRVKVGDELGDVIGVMDYSFGNYKLLVTEPIAHQNRDLARETALPGRPDELMVATLNAFNLDPGDATFGALAEQIVMRLGSPDVIGLQEIQDNSGSRDNGIVNASDTYAKLVAAITAAGGPLYHYRDIAPLDNQDGGETGGNIRVAFLFRPDRILFSDRPGGNAITAVGVTMDAAGPQLTFNPGRIDPTNAAFIDSRKPLVGEFLFDREKVFIIVAHFKSKSEDSPLFGRLQPPPLPTTSQRMAQATVVNGFVRDILALDPAAKVIVLGDLNDFVFSEPLAALRGTELYNLVERLDLPDQYTFVYDGNSQALDHILVTTALAATARRIDIVHLNAEFLPNDRPTDHDPIVVSFVMWPNRYCLPVLSRS